MIIILDFYIKNNDEETSKNNIKYKLINNKLIFNIDDDNYSVERKNNVQIRKENTESILDFNYINNKETIGTYYIKELNFYMDARIKTNKLISDDNNIEIDYELYLQDEYIGNFKIKIIVKE